MNEFNSWRSRPAAQQPVWPDAVALRAMTTELTSYPPLVLPGECDLLKERLAAVAHGEAFLLQGGDCAETFDGVSVDAIRNKIQTLAQMAVTLTYAASVPVVMVGRIAGQYSKPRSQPTETIDGMTLPAYRGDAVNGIEFTPEARTPDPRRLRRMYQASAATLNLVRALTASGYANPRDAHTWNQNFVADSPSGERYEILVGEISRALHFMHSGRVNPLEFRAVEFFTSHEGLILDYEAALTHLDSSTGLPYNTSAHLVWIGERTRDLDGAHVEYFSKIRNPIGVKIGPTATADVLLQLIERLDPDHEPGRLTFIIRMGPDKVRDELPTLIEKVTASGAQIAWVCDPMHANTFTAPSGHKTRRFDDILDEVKAFFEVHRMLGTHPGGIHVELTGDNVTECVGGSTEIVFDDLFNRYESTCDPRLNRSQSLDLAFLIAEMCGPK